MSLKDPPPWLPFLPSGVLGAAGTVLTSQGPAAAPKWAAGGGGTFSNSITVNVSVGPTDNYVPAGYVAGTTNRIIGTANAANSTVNGLGAVAPGDGWTLWWFNPSTTGSILLPNLAGTSTFNFTCPNPFNEATAPTFVIGPQCSALLMYVAALSSWVIK